MAQAAKPAGAGLGERGGEMVARRAALDGAVGAHPLARLDHPGIEHLRQHDMPVEEPRAVLVGEAELLAEPLRRDQHHRLALALEQRVGGDRGAHLDAGDAVRRDRGVRAEPEKAADAVQRRVARTGRGSPKELRAVQRARRDRARRCR